MQTTSVNRLRQARTQLPEPSSNRKYVVFRGARKYPEIAQTPMNIAQRRTRKTQNTFTPPPYSLRRFFAIEAEPAIRFVPGIPCDPFSQLANCWIVIMEK